MSGAPRPPEAAAPGSSMKPQLKLSAADQRELALLDGLFDRIKGAVQATPYILSTPSLSPYKHYSREEAEAFTMGGLFERHEESIQYRTFLFREPSVDCFVLQNGEKAADREVERPKSRAATTPHLGPKKKITLSEYKANKANGIGTPAPKSQSPNLAPTKATPVQTSAVKDGVKEVAKQPVVAKSDESKPSKRPATEILLPEKPEKRPKEETPAAPVLEKTDRSDSTMTLDIPAPANELSNGPAHGLPPMLSPHHLANPFDLPAILSPTIPAMIQTELKKMQRGESEATVLSSDKKSESPAVPAPKPPQRVAEVAEVNGVARVRSGSMNGKAPSSAPAEQASVTPDKLIVKMKYGRSNVSRVNRLLKLPPNRKAQSEIERKAKAEATATKERATKADVKAPDGVARKVNDVPRSTPRPAETSKPASRPASAAPKIPEKRPRTEDDTSSSKPTKRPKPSQDGTSTPIQQRAASPALSNKSSAQKSQGAFVTPRKDLKATSMLRTSSAEGNHLTPGESAGTPASVKHLDTKTPTPSSVRHADVKTSAASIRVNGKPHADPNAFGTISKKFNALGRVLKYEVPREPRDIRQMNERDKKRTVVTAIECILSYMAAFAAQDMCHNLQGRPSSVENTWKTLLPLTRSYTAYTNQYPHLDGLRHYLCAAIAGAICSHVTSRPVPDKDHNSPQDATHLLRLLHENYMIVVQAAKEARSTLPMDDLSKHYPKTWAGRETDSKLARGSDKPGTLSVPYFLPLGSDTTPLQAVQFGLRFLKEYSDKEKLDYKLRVNLDKPPE